MAQFSRLFALSLRRTNFAHRKPLEDTHIATILAKRETYEHDLALEGERCRL